MITKEELIDIMKESGFAKIYGIDAEEVEKIVEEFIEIYSMVGEVYAGG